MSGVGRLQGASLVQPAHKLDDVLLRRSPLDAGENRLGGNDGAHGKKEQIAPTVEPQAPACAGDFDVAVDAASVRA
jgi:hypothetical protein